MIESIFLTSALFLLTGLLLQLTGLLLQQVFDNAAEAPDAVILIVAISIIGGAVGVFFSLLVKIWS